MSRFITFIVLCICLVSCKESEHVQGVYRQFSGETMGTYYRVTFKTVEKEISQEAMEQVLEAVNESMSTYIPQSTLSRFNKSKSGIVIPQSDTMIGPVLEKAKKYFLLSRGFYDPTVLPIVNYWGFGSEKRDLDRLEAHDKIIDSLINYVNLDSIEYLEHDGHKYLRKLKDHVKLDFSSIAKGYGIDVVAAYLERNGVENYLVDIGGEARASGLNKSGKVWSMAINTPLEDAGLNSIEMVVLLDETSIATSGNYRNVYEHNGRKISHTINARTGYPERSNLLSATVITEECVDADAIATVLMVMGIAEGKEILNQIENVEACLLYDEDGDEELERWYTDGFEKYIMKQ